MGRADIVEVLEGDKNKWFTTDDIFNKLNISSKSTLHIGLKSIRKSGLVDWKKDVNPKRKNGSYKHIYFYKYRD